MHQLRRHHHEAVGLTLAILVPSYNVNKRNYHLQYNSNHITKKYQYQTGHANSIHRYVQQKKLKHATCTYETVKSTEFMGVRAA